MVRCPRRCTLFPYTTLFRSLVDDLFFQMKLAETAKQLGVEVKVAANGEALMGLKASEPRLVIVRSEEHTSELQSRFDLVCRLLLEKNNGQRSCPPVASHVGA